MIDTSSAHGPAGVDTHVLVDLDGTISNSEPGIARSLVHAFTECGYDAPGPESIRAMIGPPFEITMPKMGVHVDHIADVIAVYRERYTEVGKFENEVYAGVPEMLDGLRTAGHTLTLATAKPEETAVEIVEHFGLTHHFAELCGATEDIGSSRRTKGEVITHALHLLGISPHDRIALDHVVMVGDRDHDVEGAHLNAIDCIGVAWGFGSYAELREAGAAVVVGTPGDVVGAVATTYRSRQS